MFSIKAYAVSTALSLTFWYLIVGFWWALGILSASALATWLLHRRYRVTNEDLEKALLNSKNVDITALVLSQHMRAPK